MTTRSWPWVLLLFPVALCLAEYSHTIYVDPVNGSNTTACLTDNDASQPCRNLSYAFQYRNHSTQYLLHPGTHYLNNIASDSPFTHLEEIAIRGMGSGPEDTEVVCSTANAGLAFINVTNVDFANVTFSNCASLQNSTSKNFSSDDFELSSTQVGLYFSLCANVSMDSVHVADSPQASGVTMYNTIGVNTFTDCSFSNNANPSPVSYPGGGGVYIEFSYCLPGNVSCENGTQDSYTDHNHDSTYNFVSCMFTQNEANSLNTSNASFLVPHREHHVAFGRGGGLSIFFNGDASNNTFTISDCIFSGNKAQWGAGMFVEFHDTSGGNNVLISDNSQFMDNRCTGTAGGGLRVGHCVYGNEMASTGNQVTILESSFTGNVADNGGGVSISPTRQQAPRNELATVLISESYFYSNRATYGAALNIELYSLILDGDKPNITIAECFFFNNSVHPPTYLRPHEVGIGAVYINDVNVHFRGTTNFIINKGSALAVVGSKVDFMNCIAVFYGNTGMSGAAIALLGSSMIIVNNTTKFNFQSNNASVQGGAIYNVYTNRNNYENIPNCFIAHKNPLIYPDDWDAEFKFANNYDSSGVIPNAIYSSSILPCAFTGGSGEQSVQDILCWKHWYYDGGKECQKYIHTGPGKINIVKGFSPIQSDGLMDMNEEIPNITAYPGEIFQLPIEAVDDLDHTIPVVYTASPGINHTALGLARIDPNYTYISDGIIRIYGNDGQNLTLNLDSTGNRVWHVEITVVLQQCPPGLLPTHIKCNTTDGDTNTSNADQCNTCECLLVDNTYYGGFIRCNSLYNASMIIGYWMGTVNEDCSNNKTCLLVAECPPGYCRTGKTEFLSLPRSICDLDSVICGPQNRTGVMCGRCKDGYGPALNSDTYECVHCNITRTQIAAHAIYYILSVYLPLFVLFLAIILFNIKLTTGPANAFILYSQVISSTFDLNAGGQIQLDLFVKHSNRYLLAYRFPYGIFNLEFFEQFIPPQYLCLGTSLNTLDILLLDYIVAFFPLLMILAVVLFYKLEASCCRRCVRTKKPVGQKKTLRKMFRIGDALIPAFATFILLSYTKFSLTSSYLSSSAPFYGASGRPSPPRHAYFAGQYSVDDSRYVLIYYMPAIIVFLTFVAIPPLLLLDYPLRWFEMALRRVSRLWRHYPKDKVHIILDAFQGCYKNKWRFFAGLYFIFRLLINVTYIYANPVLKFSLQEVYCVVFALLVAFLKPYKMDYHIFNYVDSFIFLNLAIINQISLYIYSYTRNGTTPPDAKLTFAIQYILVFLPLLYMIAYVLWSTLPIPRLRSRANEWLRNRQYQQYESLIQQSHSSVDPSEDIDWERAHDINSYSPTSHVAGHDSSPPPVKQIQTESADSGLQNKSSEESGSRSYGSTGQSTLVTFDTSIPGRDD